MEKEKSKITILVVDDSQHIQNQLATALKEIGFTKIDFAHDEKDGKYKFDQAVKNKNPYDLVLLDLYLPDMTGLDLLKHVRQKKKDQTPFIILTSETNRKNILGAIRDGANNYIIKPATKEILEEKIEAVLTPGEKDNVASTDDGTIVNDHQHDANEMLDIASDVIRYDYNLLNSVFSSTSDLIIVIDEEGIIVRTNPAMCKTVGLTKGEMVGISINRFLQDDDKLVHRITETNLHEHRSFFVSAEKKHIPVLISSSQHLTENGEIKGRIITAKNFEREYELQNQLTYTAKMVGIGEMANGVAHEINTPLTVILGKVKIIMRELCSENINVDKIMVHLERIKKNSMGINEILKALMVFSSSTTANKEGGNIPQVISIHSLIDQTLALCKNNFSRNDVNIEVGKISETVNIECCQSQISQVLLNIFLNSYYFTRELTERWIKIEIIEYGKKIEILVTDSGKGISDELVDRIFTPFFTTKVVGKGVGLGLSVAKGIVDQHGGEIALDKKCKNTRFIITLPKKYQTLLK